MWICIINPQTITVTKTETTTVVEGMTEQKHVLSILKLQRWGCSNSSYSGRSDRICIKEKVNFHFSSYTLNIVSKLGAKVYLDLLIHYTIGVNVLWL